MMKRLQIRVQQVYFITMVRVGYLYKNYSIPKEPLVMNLEILLLSPGIMHLWDLKMTMSPISTKDQPAYFITMARPGISSQRLVKVKALLPTYLEPALVSPETSLS